MTDPVELLFFDTFSHDNSEELNLDLVQFPKPVYVTEVRIIPLGARVQADFPGGVRLGATNPSQFSIEFFVNDLGKPGASTFESLGGFDYNQNGCIHLDCVPQEPNNRQIPTDGLVLRGWYTTITLAVYGTLTRAITEQIIQASVPGPAIPPQPTALPPENQQILTQQPSQVEPTWQQHQEVAMPPVQMDYAQPQAVNYGTPNYNQAEPIYQHPQQSEYEYYNAEPPKDPRPYHSSEPEWDSKSSRQVPSERERGRRERHYSRSHSRDRERDYRETSREREYEVRRRERSASVEYREKEWDRGYNKHQEPYKRCRDSSYEREEPRKRPRTPPPKRPHTPHGDTKDLSPGDVESISEEEIGSAPEHELKHGDKSNSNDSLPVKAIDLKNLNSDSKSTPLHSPSIHEDNNLMDVEQFEPILSDEEICDEIEQFQDLDYDYSCYVNNDDLIKLFNPFNAELQRFHKPAIFTEIKDHLILKPEDEDVRISKEREITDKINDFFNKHGENLQKITEIFKTLDDNIVPSNFNSASGALKEEWVQLSDQLPPLLNNNITLNLIVDLTLFVKQIDFKYVNFIINHPKYTEGKEALEKLFDWIQIGLNFEYALSQPQPCFKIRHIKSGIRLVEALCSSSKVIEILINRNIDIQKNLLDLYAKEYMSLSLKLMIFRALDASLTSQFAIDYFLGFVKKRDDSSGSLYQTLTKILLTNPSARAKFSITSIINKMNAYEMLREIKNKVTQWHKINFIKIETDECVPEISDDDIDFLRHSLDKILQTYREGPFVMSQEKRFLPVSAQFDINRKDAEDNNILYTFFNIHNLLEVLLFLLTYPSLTTCSVITSNVYEIISELLKHYDGIVYLADDVDAANLLVRCLLQNSTSEDEAQYSRGQNIGLTLSYKLQAFNHIEALEDLAKKYDNDPDANEILDNIHALYCLTYSNVGKLAVTSVLSMKDNIKSLTQFLNGVDFEPKNEKSEAQLSKIKKSPGIAYIVDLIAMTIAFCSTNVKFLETHGKSILAIANHADIFEPSINLKLNEIYSYLKPLEFPTVFAYDNVSYLCEIVKNSIDIVTKLPEELITALRILKYLGISPYENASLEIRNEYTELKYKHVILQLYSSDGVSNLMSILQKICEYYEQPSLHTTAFISNQGASVVNIILPCVQLIRRMLTLVIACRNMQFKDLTSIPILLQTYTLMSVFPSSSILYFDARKICNEIIETLLAYTQPVSEEINENESLNKSLWTLMACEVIKYVTTAPFTFIPGLLIFSELLPLPLPIQTRVPLTPMEIQRSINLRKLWSAHLHLQANNIQELINTMIASSYQPLLHLLKRVCIQLSDLAANTALMICRGILDTVLGALSSKLEKTPPEPCNNHTARLLNFLASLQTHGAIKCAVMYLLRTNPNNTVKGDEKFPNLVTLFCQVLKFYNDTPSHLQAQECVISIIQSFCDNEITLLQQNVENKSEVNSDVYLGNALPAKDMLLNFIAAMVEHLTATESCYATLLPIIRTFILLTEHDYGFYHLRTCLERKPKAFNNVFTKFCTNFSKDNSDCLATLSATIEFLRICLSTEYLEAESGLMFTPRTLTLTANEVCALVGWTSQETDSQQTNGEPKKHPILTLEKLLQTSASEDDTLENLSESYLALVKVLNTPTATAESHDPIPEPVLPPPEPLLAQFAARHTFTISSDITDERMSAAYWLSPPADECDAEVDQIPCDLSEICRQLLPADVNLCRETERVCRVARLANAGDEEGSADLLKPKRAVIDQHRYVTGVIDKLKRPFISPMRGRGFPRTVPQRGDLFRSRPPNTSRPPSLHVDDFVALETCGAQPTGPTGYNKLSREILTTVRGSNRGRGRAFVSPDRGAHFRQIRGRGTPIWPGAHVSDTAVVTTAPQHFRVATDTPAHFTTIRGTIRGRGIPRIRDVMPVRHVRTFPRQ